MRVALRSGSLEAGVSDFRCLWSTSHRRASWKSVVSKSTWSFSLPWELLPRSGPEDLGLSETPEALGPHAEALFPVDAPVDPGAGDRGDLRFLPDERREFGQEFVENERVLKVKDDELQSACPTSGANGGYLRSLSDGLRRRSEEHTSELQ